MYGSLKRYDEAEEIINKGISINPSSPLGYYYLGRIAFDRKKMGKAVGYYKKALKVDPAFKPAYIGIGIVYEAQEKYKDAIKEYRRLLDEVDMHDREARGRLVQLLFAAE